MNARRTPSNRTRRSARKRHLNSRRLGVESLESRDLLAAVITVNATADVNARDSVLTLREAILVNNRTLAVGSLSASERALVSGTPSSSDADTIRFNIPAADAGHFYYRNDGAAGSVSLSQVVATTAANDASIADIDLDWTHSWFSIRPTAALPDLSDQVTIDGYTQGGATPNTNEIGLGLNSVLKIEISGAQAGQLGNALLNVNGGSGTTIRGLVLNRVEGPKVILNSGAGGAIVAGNYLGSDVSGALAFAPPTPGSIPGFLRSNAVLVNGPGNQIGGSTAAARNLISANTFATTNLDTAISLRGFGAPTSVEGNLIGTNRAGTHALGNVGSGVLVDSPGATIRDNVISANPVGVSAHSGNANGVTIDGNWIGTDVTGAIDLGNTGAGLSFSFGDGNQVIENTIAFNGSGVNIGGDSTGILISRNAIFSNDGLGIDLSGQFGLGEVDRNDVPPESDPPDQDTGGNYVQNHPILASVADVGADTRVVGSLTSTPNSTFRIEIFATAERDDTAIALLGRNGEFGEGQTWIGSTDVTTNGSGAANFSIDLPDMDLLSLPGAGGQPFVTATATDITNPGSGPLNNTSEFSPVVPLGGLSTVVTRTGETGLGTLREAIYSANFLPGLQTITFNIPASDSRHFYYSDDGLSGEVTFENTTPTTATNDAQIADIDPDWPHSWYNVLPTRELPEITDAVTIDGYSQPGAIPNSVPLSEGRLDTVLRIELDGRNVPGNGLTVTHHFPDTDGAGSIIQGLSINAFGGNGIELNTLDGGNVVSGNFIGSDIAGILNFGNGGGGVFLFVDDDDVIGGPSTGDRNLISGNAASQVELFGGSGTFIVGNVLGGDRIGTAAFASAGATIHLHNDAGRLGAHGSQRSGGATIQRDARKPVRIRENFDERSLDLGHGFEDGMIIESTTLSPVLPATEIQQSYIDLKDEGVELSHKDEESQSQRIYVGVRKLSEASPPSLGIDLGGDGVTANDPGDLDEGPNGLQNYPVLTSAQTIGATTTIAGTLNSLANTSFRIELYASSYDTQTLRAGERSLGIVDVSTDASGNASFSFVSPDALPGGEHVISLATRLDDLDGDPQTPLEPIETSEFSDGIVVTAVPLIEFENGVLTVTGTPGDDLIRFAWRPGNEVQVRVNGVIHGHYVPTRVVAHGLAGADDIKIDKVLGLPPVEFHGGPGNDRLTSAFANDQLFGDEGRDLLSSGNGHDRLFGGADDDNLFGDNGNDVLYGDAGNDRLRGYTGNDLVFGGAGRDYILGDDGNNVLVGGADADRLGSAAGRNILIGGLARDLLEGGNGGSILIGGSTTHDQNETALLALLAEWASTRTLDQRIARLTAGVGAGNQYALTLGGTVTNDNSSNVLTGGDGEDWFFKFRKDALVEADPLVDDISE